MDAQTGATRRIRPPLPPGTGRGPRGRCRPALPRRRRSGRWGRARRPRSEEHTSELQSLTNLVCRLLLEKKKKKGKSAALVPTDGPVTVTMEAALDVDPAHPPCR